LKVTVWRRRPQTGTTSSFAPTRCGPVGGAELEFGNIEIDAPELARKFKWFWNPSKKLGFW
jgi:hypothetical protein